MLGYLYKIGTSDVQVQAIGFLGIAVALLGRDTANSMLLRRRGHRGRRRAGLAMVFTGERHFRH